MRNVPLRPLCGRLLRSPIARGDDARRAKDAEWIADLVRHGLVRASFVPPPEIRVLRELIRHRKAAAGTLAAERNRTMQPLESAGIKLAGVMGDVFGVSGMLMLRALAEGSADAAAMADLAKRRLRRDYLDRVNKHRTAKRLIRRLDALGCDVMLRPKPAA